MINFSWLGCAQQQIKWQQGTQMILVTFSAKTGHFANCEDFHGDFVGNLIN
jgi:hypothetical protein